MRRIIINALRQMWHVDYDEVATGADAYVITPFRAGTLVTEIESALTRLTSRIEGHPDASLWEAILRSAFDGFCVFDADRRFVVVNDAYCQMSGYTREALLAMRLTEMDVGCSPDELARRGEQLRRGTALRFDTQHRHKDGHLVPVEVSARFVPEGGGRVFAFVRDLTDRRHVEALLHASTDELNHAQRLARIGSAWHDLRTGTTSWSDELYRIFDRDPAMPPPTFDALRDAFTPVSWAQLAAARHAFVQHDQRFDLDLDLIRSDGTRRRVRYIAEAEYDANGQPLRVRTTVQDLTDRLHLEDQLRQAHKMEAIGRLAGGVAHDFNNLLLVINGYSQALLSQVPAIDPMHAKLAEISRAGQRAQELTSRLLGFSRKQVLETEVLDLNSLVGDIETLLQRIIGEDVRIVIRCDAGIGSIRADRTQITQVLMNLAVNARDAMPQGGTLTFETANANIDEEYVPHARPGEYTVLTVTDTGVGMDAETLAHVFEPFYTTKEQGKGTGLGLSTVYGLVAQHGGWISVHSRPGEGAIFQIYWPRVDVPVAAPPADPQAVGHLRGSETILVVDDQPDVRELVGCMLNEWGYQVRTAAGGRDAVRLAETDVASFDLVLSDVVMPEMGGAELAARLNAIRPTPVLFMSGNPSGLDALDNPSVAYIQKPFTSHALVTKIRHVLASRP